MNKSVLYKPLKYFIYFIIITLFFSMFGPKVYRDYNKIIVVTYIIFFLLFFSFGFVKGIKSKVIERHNFYYKFTNKIFPLLKYSIVISFFIVAYDFITMLLLGKIDLSLANIGQNYIDFNQYRNLSYREYNFQTILFFLGGFPKLVTLVLGLYYFSKLQSIYKYLVVITIVLIIFTRTIAIGNLISLGNIFLFVVVVLFIKLLDMSPERRLKIVRNIFLYSSIALFIFLIVMSQRLEAVGATPGNINSRLVTRSYFNFDHIIFVIFGFKYGLPIAYFITGYLSGGYYGLSLSMQLPFVWTYGIGNSYTLSIFLERFLGFPSVFNQIYPVRMEMATGWKGLQYWNTIFPWLASDFTFIGTLFFFIPFAYIYAVSWKEIVLFRNPISILMFAMLTLGVIFIPMNNQLLHSINNFIMTITMTFVWIRYHKKFNVRSVSS